MFCLVFLVNFQETRTLFPVTEKYAYLDNASTSPIPKPVFEASRNHDQERSLLGELAWDRWMMALEETRELVAQLIHARKEEIAFTKNTSEGINVIAQGIRWKRGDSVITSSVEFPSNLYPWLQLRSRGVKVKIVKPEPDGHLSLTRLKHSIDDSTKLIAISHVQYGSGYKIDLRALREISTDRCLIAVDGIQSMGAVDVDSRHVDFIAAGGHKWLLAPFGIGVLYVSRKTYLEPASVGWASAKEPEKFLHNLRLATEARRFEAGNLSYSGIYGLRASLQLFFKIGVSRIEDRIKKLVDTVVSSALERKFSLQTPESSDHRAGIVNIRMRGARRTARELAKKQVVVSSRMDGLRISPHFYNDEEDIQRVFINLK